MQEKYILILIYIHASLGGLALLAGLVAMIARKGKKVHKKSGLVFMYAMLSSAAMAMLIGVMPEHVNPFLFAIGLFSSYFILIGYRALRFKKKVSDLTIDKLLAYTMLATCVFMILYPIVTSGSFNVVLLVFGIVGIVLATRDIIRYTTSEKLKQEWLKLHLGNMMGGYIAAATAFVVVNKIIPGVYAWFIPGLLGTAYIIYWNRKIHTKDT